MGFWVFVQKDELCACMHCLKSLAISIHMARVPLSKVQQEGSLSFVGSWRPNPKVPLFPSNHREAQVKCIGNKPNTPRQRSCLISNKGLLRSLYSQVVLKPDYSSCTRSVRSSSRSLLFKALPQDFLRGRVHVKGGYKVSSFHTVGLDVLPRPGFLIVTMKAIKIPLARSPLSLLLILDESMKVVSAILVLFWSNHPFNNRRTGWNQSQSLKCFWGLKVHLG